MGSFAGGCTRAVYLRRSLHAAGAQLRLALSATCVRPKEIFLSTQPKIIVDIDMKNARPQLLLLEMQEHYPYSPTPSLGRYCANYTRWREALA